MVGKNSQGYTIIEVIVIVGIIAVVAVIGFNVVGGDRTAKFGQDFDELTAQLRGLQSDARAAKGNEEFGACFEADGWTAYSIPQDSTADPCASGYTGQLHSEDFQVASLAAVINPSATRITFERVTGRTKGNSAAELTLTVQEPDRTRVLRVESNGAIHEE